MNSIEDGHIYRPPIFEGYEVYSSVGGNPTLEIDKGERAQFPYKRGSIPLDFKEEKKRNHGPSPPKKVGDPNDP